MMYLPQLSKDEAYRRQLLDAEAWRDAQVEMLRWLTPPPQRNPESVQDYAARYNAIQYEYQLKCVPPPPMPPPDDPGYSVFSEGYSGGSRLENWLFAGFVFCMTLIFVIVATRGLSL